MTKKLFNLVLVISILFNGRFVKAGDLAILSAEFRDAITNSKSQFSPFVADQTYSVLVRLYEISGNEANNVLGLFRYKRNELQFIGPADDCAELAPFDLSSSDGKIVCAYNAISTRKTRTLNFQLVDKNTCGNGRRVSLGYGFSASGTNTNGGVLAAIPPTVEVICGEPVEPEPTNDVDMRLRFSQQAPTSINNYDLFTVRLVAENIEPNKLDIFGTKVELNVPSALEHVPAYTASDNCIQVGSGKLSCDYITLRPGKTKEIAFRLKNDTTPCQNRIGTYAFTATGVSNPTAINQIRNELDSANNTNVASSNFTVTCENVPDIRFGLLDASHIDLVNPEGGASMGSPGKWGGELVYAIEIYNPTNHELDIGIVDYTFNDSGSITSMRDRVDFGNTSSPGCTSDRYRVSCDFGTVQAGAKVIKNFSLIIKQPNPYSDRSPFDPLAVCTQNKINLRSFEIDEIVDFDKLKGLNKQSSTYFTILDSRVLTGLDCLTQIYNP